MDRLKSLARQTKQRLFRNLQNTMKTNLPEDVANLFVSNDVSGPDVNWSHIHALLAEEVATRQFQAPSVTAANTRPCSGPKKRRTGEPSPILTESADVGTDICEPSAPTPSGDMSTANLASSSDLPDTTVDEPKRKGPQKRRTGEACLP